MQSELDAPIAMYAREEGNLKVS